MHDSCLKITWVSADNFTMVVYILSNLKEGPKLTFCHTCQWPVTGYETVFVWFYLNIHTHTHTHTHARTHAHTHTHTHTHTRTRTRTHTRTHARAHAHTHTHTHRRLLLLKAKLFGETNLITFFFHSPIILSFILLYCCYCKILKKSVVSGHIHTVLVQCGNTTTTIIY